MVYGVVIDSASPGAEVFGIECRLEPRQRETCSDGVRPDLATFRPRADMTTSFRWGRQLCEGLVAPPSLWRQYVIGLTAPVRSRWQRPLGLALTVAGATGVAVSTMLVPAVAAFWPGEPFILPLTGLTPRAVFWILLGAGLLGLLSWAHVRRALVRRRDDWKRFETHLADSCVRISVEPATTHEFVDRSIALACACALARHLPDAGQPFALDWQAALRDPAKRWLIAVGIADDLGTLRPVGGIAEKLDAILRHNRGPAHSRITHVVFHRDNQTDVEKAWAAAGRPELRIVNPHWGGYRLARCDGLTFVFCHKKSSVVRGLRHPDRTWSGILLAAAVVVGSIATFTSPAAVPPRFGVTCPAVLAARVDGTMLYEVPANGVVLCTLNVSAVGFPGPFSITLYQHPSGDSRSGSPLRVVTDAKVTDGRPLLTRQRALDVYYSPRLAGNRDFSLATFTITNRAGRSATASVMFKHAEGPLARTRGMPRGFWTVRSARERTVGRRAAAPGGVRCGCFGQQGPR